MEATAAHGRSGLEVDQIPDLTRLVSTANRIANVYDLSHPYETSHASIDENCLAALNMSKEELDELVDWAQVGLLAAESVL